jgi:CheY-like chemotaxis protein
LLIEDNVEEEKLALKALKRAGISAKIQVAKDGDGALTFLRHQNRAVLPDLVFISSHLCRDGATDAIRQIRGHQITSRVPIIILSSSGHTLETERCRKAGADGFITRADEIDKYLDELGIAALFWTTANVRDEELT